MFQTPFSEMVRNEVGVPTIAVGNITTADQVNTIVAAGRADICALARAHLTNPHFTLTASAEYGYDASSGRCHTLPAKTRPSGLRNASRRRWPRCAGGEALQPRSAARDRAGRGMTGRHPFYTIGHSTHPLAEFVDMLRQPAVTFLVDVRTVPRSAHQPAI